MAQRSDDSYESERMSDEDFRSWPPSLSMEIRHSRIVSELRPVENPERALSRGPDRERDGLEPRNSDLRVATDRVRTNESWSYDLGIYMYVERERSWARVRSLSFWSYRKRWHPFFSLWGADRDHPFKRGDRCLVLGLALLVTLLLSGLFAIRECCSQVQNLPIAIVNRRLATRSSSLLMNAKDSHDRDSIDEWTQRHCLAVYANCSHVVAVCPHGSTCQSVKIDERHNESSRAMQCIPDETRVHPCVTGHCPLGWVCSKTTSNCVVTSPYVCELNDLIANESKDDSKTGAPRLQRSTIQHQQVLGLVNTLETTAKHSTITPAATVPSTSPASHRGDSLSRPFRSTINVSSESLSSETASVRVAIFKPSNDQVYSLSSTIMIEWRVTLLSGPDPGLHSFRVDFSADNRAFSPIAYNISTASSQDDTNTSVFQYNWTLAGNTSWLCTDCVLRVCALDVASVPDDSLCLRTDRPSTSNRRLQSFAVDNNNVTFRIVEEVFGCTCGLTHAPFLLAALVIAVCIPIVALLAEPFVTFYRDMQLCGLFARRDGPVRPVIAGYTTASATRKGRVILFFVALALCVAFGMVAAQITTTRFFTEKGAIIALWVVIFAIAVGVGAIIYCTLLWLVFFSVWWWYEGDQERLEITNLSQSRYLL